MKCPVCGDPDLLMTSREGIEIDYCPNCRGVWLDRGELDKIVSRSAIPAERVENRESRHYDRDYKHGRNKPKNLLKELFDF